MPFTTDSDLPKYVANKPQEIKNKWILIFNAAQEKYGENKAMIIANTWLKKIITSKKLEAQTMEAKTTVETLTFELAEGELIKQTEDGEEYVDFVLVDDKTDNKGNKWNAATLKKWTDGINNGEISIVGDTDHEGYNDVVSKVVDPAKAAALIKNLKKGFAKSVKAIYDNGKMWVRAIIDKRYRTKIRNAKGVSLEAMATRDINGNIVDGELLGFTFAVKGNPVNPRAVIA